MHEQCRGGGDVCVSCAGEGRNVCVSRAGEGRNVRASHVACELYSYLTDAFCRCEF